MYIVLDSNIYCADFFVKSAPLNYLIHFLNNEGHTLVIPRVVIEEVANVRTRKVKEELETLRKSMTNVRRMSQVSIHDMPSEMLSEQYDLAAMMKAKVEDVEIAEYSTVEHKSIFRRALEVKRPFRPNEKGYRDTLLWLSLLDHLRAKGTESEVVFINANKGDFYADGTSIAFHDDLLADLKSLSHVLIRPFLSVTEFVEAEIDKVEHAIDRRKAEPIFEEYLEQQALQYFESGDTKFLALLENKVLPRTGVISSAVSVKAELMEGIEDYEITTRSDLGNGEFYVACEHDLRILVLEISIPSSIYLLHKPEIDSSSYIYETEEDGRNVVLKMATRAYLSTSFTFNLNSETCDGYSVSLHGFR